MSSWIIRNFELVNFSSVRPTQLAQNGCFRKSNYAFPKRRSRSALFKILIRKKSSRHDYIRSGRRRTDRPVYCYTQLCIHYKCRLYVLDGGALINLFRTTYGTFFIAHMPAYKIRAPAWRCVTLSMVVVVSGERVVGGARYWVIPVRLARVIHFRRTGRRGIRLSTRVVGHTSCCTT